MSGRQIQPGSEPPRTDLAGASCVVVGAGVSGRAAVDLLLRQQARVCVVERPGVDVALDRRVRRAGDDDLRVLDGADVVVPSPGVARQHPLLAAAVERGVRVWSEIELAARFLDCPIVAITGTNGKSTTTVLIGNMIANADRRVFVGGNLGTPLCQAVGAGEAYDFAVVEVSSFQLEWLDAFRPRVAVWLNLTADHLDRYAGIEDYEDAKAGLLRALAGDGTAVLNRDDERVWRHRVDVAGEVFSFGLSAVEHGVFFAGGDAVVRRRGCADERVALSGRPLRGAHNSENMLAAVAVATVLDLPASAVDRALDATVGLPHRLELVGEHNGARYFDDSKATNVGAVEKSIASFDDRIILLLGGYDKGGDFRSLRPSLAARVDKVVCFGAAGPAIAAQLGGVVDCDVVGAVADAVRLASTAVRPGQAVVLAPGCASFDEFRDYAERGRHYRSLVEAL